MGHTELVHEGKVALVRLRGDVGQKGVLSGVADLCGVVMLWCVGFCNVVWGESFDIRP